MFDSEWILDSDCSFLNFLIKEWFVNLKIVDSEYMMLQDNFEYKIRGIGEI